jgi:hypothetical protein
MPDREQKKCAYQAPTAILLRILCAGRGQEERRVKMMKATRLLHDLGQSIWLDNITRDLLDSEC